MDGFEALVRLLLERDGYWTRQSHKVELSKEEKKEIGLPSMPRPEIDLLAFNQSSNTVVVWEVKSYLDSLGVQVEDLSTSHEKPEGRYKLFTCENYRAIVFDRLLKDLCAKGLADSQTKIRLGLAAGKIHRNRSDTLTDLFASKNWMLMTPQNIRENTSKLAKIGYENNPFVLTAKVLLR